MEGEERDLYVINSIMTGSFVSRMFSLAALVAKKDANKSFPSTRIVLMP